MIVVTWCHRVLQPGEKLTDDEQALLARICEAYYLPEWCSVADYETMFGGFCSCFDCFPRRIKDLADGIPHSDAMEKDTLTAQCRIIVGVDVLLNVIQFMSDTL